MEGKKRNKTAAKAMALKKCIIVRGPKKPTNTIRDLEEPRLRSGRAQVGSGIGQVGSGRAQVGRAQVGVQICTPKRFVRFSPDLSNLFQPFPDCLHLKP